jgi:glycosyltransferase involved in cell wall biosynthesis
MNLLAYVHLRNIHGSTGAGRVARQLVEHLAPQPGLEMRVLADPGDHRRIVPVVGDPWPSYRYHFIANETSKQQAQWFFLGSPSAEQYWPEAEVVFCTAESYVPARKARLAVTLHDAAFFEQGAHVAGAAFWKQKLKWKVLYHTLSRKADMFHTVSEFSAGRLAHFFPSISSRLRVVHNAVPPRFFERVSEAGQQYLREQGLCTRPFILLPRGLAHRKNADLVLRSWPALKELYPDLRLVITSHSDAPYADRARALGDSVLLTGFVSDEALCSLYHAAQVVWFPSLYEGFGLPVLEAMACGAPVVASNSSSLPEVAGDAATLVSPHSDDEHIEAISELLDEPGKRDRLRGAGMAHASAFTWESSARKLYGYFSELV